MEPQTIVPEFLHKDELAYELEVRGINTEGLNVADLRSLFRKSREVEENPGACTNSDIFLAPNKVVTFCYDRFQQIKNLVENTDCSSIGLDFPRYLHRLRHVSTRLRHLLQLGKLAPDVRADMVNFQEEVQQYMQYMIAQVDSLQRSHASGDQPAAVSFLKVQGAAPSDFNSAELQSGMHLTVPKLTPDTCLPSQAQPLSPSQGVPPVVNYDSSTLGGSLRFADLPNPVHKMLESLHVTDGLTVSELIEFLRALVRLRLMAPAFRISTAQILQILYGFAKGPLASKILAAIHSGDTLDAFHEHLLAFFILPRTMLPLLNVDYYRRQRKDEPLAVYVADIKEIAAVFRQDIDQSAVVRNILDGLHPYQRSCLVFSDKPHSYADLDNMCVYAHNVESKGYNVGNELPTQPVASNSARSVRSGNPVSRAAPVVCFRCKKAGHTRRDCRTNLQSTLTFTSRGHPPDS